MGNAQSAGHQSPHHHRLSKPKTNTNSPGPPQKTDSPVSVSSKYTSLSNKERQQIKTQLLSPVDTEFGFGGTLDRDDGLGELATNLQRRLSTLSRSNSLSCFGSTNKLGSLPGSKLSLVSNSQAVDLDTTLKILQEVKRTASPKDLAALHEALQPSTSCASPRPSPIPEQGLSRRNSAINRSSSSLIRRRSLLATPGVATRNSPVEGKRRTWNSWRTSRPQTQEAKWKVEMMGNSPLARLAALDLAEDARDSPTPRACTPGDMEYSHLGSLKLGSLVVTNGAASPAPSTKFARRNSNPSLAQEEDYFTGSPIMMKPTKRRGHGRSKSALQPSMPPLFRNACVPEEVRAKMASRCDSPLKAETQSHGLYDEPESEPMRRLRIINKSADTLARDYQSEIPNSPFDATYAAQVDDHDEGFASGDAVSFRQEALRILDSTIFNEPAATLEPPKFEPQISHIVPASMEMGNKKRANKRPPPKKADSGYSSGGSLRTVNREVLNEGTVPNNSEKPSLMADLPKSGNGSNNEDAASLYTFEQMLRLPVSPKPQPQPPTDDNVAPRPSVQIPVTKPQSLDPISRVLEVSSQPTGSPKTPVSIVSQFSIDSKSSAQRRLQKRRPSCQELPVVQSVELVREGSIPDIPQNVRANFVRRLSETPGMEYLTRTYPSKDHATADESEVGSFAAVNIEFPSPPASPDFRGRHHQRSATERPPTPPPHGIRRSLSLFRRKSTAEKQAARVEDNEALAVMDLGTTAASLGRSPYDVAIATLPKQTVTSPTHPHQLGNVLPRAKSMVNMDAQTAAQLARMRSKDRASLRPSMPQRPRSYHDMNLEAGEGLAYKRRPHTFSTDVPPVPSSEPNQLSVARQSMPQDGVEQQTWVESSHSSMFRARQTGRGPIVSQLIEKYDQRVPHQDKQDWASHARLWSQRCKSIGEGLRQGAEDSQSRTFTMEPRAVSQPPEDIPVVDRYSGGLDYGYERGYGIGGSAGTRQLHSYASRKSMHYSNHYGVDLSDVPVFMQRA